MSKLYFPFRLSCFLLLSALIPVSGLLAQVAVVEAGSTPAGATADTAVSAPLNTASGELFFQLQLLQDEMMQLRGIIEEQQHQIRQLKQQRLDDYLSLDKRIGELYDAGAIGSSPGSDSATSNIRAATGEESAYKGAYGLVKAQKFAEARAAFESFLKSYPAGKYTPNAFYWMGELQLLVPNLEGARQSFTQLVDQYPEHRKVPDATFKLAKVYHLQGDAEKANKLLTRVITSYGDTSSSAVKLAKDYLQKNF